MAGSNLFPQKSTEFFQLHNIQRRKWIVFQACNGVVIGNKQIGIGSYIGIYKFIIILVHAYQFSVIINDNLFKIVAWFKRAQKIISNVCSPEPFKSFFLLQHDFIIHTDIELIFNKSIKYISELGFFADAAKQAVGINYYFHAVADNLFCGLFTM